MISSPTPCSEATNTRRPAKGPSQAGPGSAPRGAASKLGDTRETVELARTLNLEPCTTPSYSPESNGMAEAFVKTFATPRAFAGLRYRINQAKLFKP